MLRSWLFPISLVALCLAPLMRLPAQAAATPITLRDVIDSVAAHHPRIAAAEARERASQGARASARALTNPWLSFDVENARLPGGSSPSMDRETMTTVMLPLESIYQRSALVRRADADVGAAAYDTRAERQRIVLEATHAFYRVALSQVAVETAEDLVQWLDSIVAYDRVRVDEGVTAEVNLIRTQLERDRAAVESALREADLARDRMALAAFLGDPGSTSTMRVAAPASAPLPLPSAFSSVGGANTTSVIAPTGGPTLSREQVNRAIDARPDILAARERVAAASAAVSVERSMIFRELSATIGTKQSAGVTTLLAGVSLPAPFFNQHRGEIARASAERDAVSADVTAAERDARGEVAGALAAAEGLTARARSFAGVGANVPAYLTRADDARRIALGAYREGGAQLAQVIDAARARGDARMAYFELLYAQHESVLTLMAAAGLDLTSVGALTGTGGGALDAPVIH
jgi:cobalt-zinc-cadmium efflux system outer membrane protein